MTTIAEPRTRICDAEDHDWSLRDVDFEDAGVGGGGTRRFECVNCGAVRFD